MREYGPTEKIPPTHRHCGQSKDRQQVGLPGHCKECAAVGHVAAHPDLGCGDVGCNAAHDEVDEADTAPARQMYAFEVQDLTFEQAMQILRDLHAKGFEAESVPVNRDRSPRRF